MGTKFKGIKTAKEYERGELTKDLLRLVGAGVQASAIIGAAVVAPNTVQLIEYFSPSSATERHRIWKAIKYLEAKHSIRIEERRGAQYVVLTQKGKRSLNENTIWELTIEKPQRWDRHWRFVMFDFPRRYEKSRHAFRIKLEDLGFVMYQRSVFIYPFECHEEVRAIAQWFGVDEHIRYIVASEVHDMRRFAKLFDLV